MRKALVVGIDHYSTLGSLQGCVRDAEAVKEALELNPAEKTRNFDVHLLTAKDQPSAVPLQTLKRNVQALFADDVDIAFFYFAGHGYIDTLSGYLLASDNNDGDDGLSLGHVAELAKASKARSKVIVLDSCYAGNIGAKPGTNWSEIGEGVTFLSACTERQMAHGSEQGGVFTRLFVDALKGGAANLTGDVTPGSAYAYVDQSLGNWEQRPVFKTNVKNFISLCKVKAPIALAELLRLTEFFPNADHEFPLDPSFEPTSKKAKQVNTERLAVLQNYNRVNLVVPVGAEHMYFAAMESKSCKLTVLGQHYHRLVQQKRIR